MQIPPNAKTFETDLSVMWFDDQGILCSVYKKDAVLTKKALERSFELIRMHTGNKKVCWLGEVSHLTPPDKETRDFSAEETPKFIKALAILSYSPFGNFIANLFLTLKNPPYPTKIFSDENKAREWLSVYLKNNTAESKNNITKNEYLIV